MPTALILLNLQNEFLDPRGEMRRGKGDADEAQGVTDAVVGAVNQIVADALRNEVHVVCARLAFRPDYVDFGGDRSTWALVLEAVQMGRRPWVSGRWGSAIVEGVNLPSDCLTLETKSGSAFEHTVLDRCLQRLGVDRVVLAGGPVHSAVQDTARHAISLGYRVDVVEGATFDDPWVEEAPVGRFARAVAPDEVFPSAADDLRASERRYAPSDPEVGLTEFGVGRRTRTALLLVDVQNTFVHPEGAVRATTASRMGGSDVDDLLARLNRLLDHCRDIGHPVVRIESSFVDAASENAMLPVGVSRQEREALGPLPIEGSWAAARPEGLASVDGEVAIIKKGRSAFRFTPLDRILRNLGVRTCLIAGGSVRGCVASTVREGVALGYDMVLVDDAVFPGGEVPAGARAHVAGYARISTIEQLEQERESAGRVAPAHTDTRAVADKIDEEESAVSHVVLRKPGGEA